MKTKMKKVYLISSTQICVLVLTLQKTHSDLCHLDSVAQS